MIMFSEREERKIPRKAAGWSGCRFCIGRWSGIPIGNDIAAKGNVILRETITKITASLS